MEQQDKIRIIEAKSFNLPQDELKVLYTYLALFQYRFLIKPNYNQRILLEKLNKDIKKFLVESQSLSEQFPNNHSLNRILTFFDSHHKHLSRIIADADSQERGVD